MRTALVLTILLFLVGGALMGFGALAGGPIIGILAAFVVVILLSRRRELGSYLAGFGLAGVALLGHVMLTCAAPSCKYDVSTPIATVGFALIAAAGAGLLGWSLARR